MLDFLGIGAQKAGTTWLHAMLAPHPAIGFPGGKEIHFWDADYRRGVSWYRSLFEQPEYRGRIQGEITPAYAILPLERVREIRAGWPDLRLVYLLRNPVDRAWSSALMALRRAEMRIDEASDQWFLDHFRSAGSLRRGDYAACLETWTSVFPREQILVRRYESIAADPRALLMEVARHLGADPAHYRRIPEPELRQRIFAGDGQPLRETLREPLQDLYRERIARLHDCLGEDCGWLD